MCQGRFWPKFSVSCEFFQWWTLVAALNDHGVFFFLTVNKNRLQSRCQQGQCKLHHATPGAEFFSRWCNKPTGFFKDIYLWHSMARLICKMIVPKPSPKNRWHMVLIRNWFIIADSYLEFRVVLLSTMIDWGRDGIVSHRRLFQKLGASFSER